jgi:hypothetical protein
MVEQEELVVVVVTWAMIFCRGLIGMGGWDLVG